MQKGIKPWDLLEDTDKAPGCRIVWQTICFIFISRSPITDGVPFSRVYLKKKIVLYPFFAQERGNSFHYFLYKNGKRTSFSRVQITHSPYMVCDSVRCPKASVNSQIHKKPQSTYLSCTCVLTNRGNKLHRHVDDRQTGRLTC